MFLPYFSLSLSGSSARPGSRVGAAKSGPPGRPGAGNELLCGTKNKGIFYLPCESVIVLINHSHPSGNAQMIEQMGALKEQLEEHESQIVTMRKQVLVIVQWRQGGWTKVRYTLGGCSEWMKFSEWTPWPILGRGAKQSANGDDGGLGSVSFGFDQRQTGNQGEGGRRRGREEEDAGECRRWKLHECNFGAWDASSISFSSSSFSFFFLSLCFFLIMFLFLFFFFFSSSGSSFYKISTFLSFMKIGCRSRGWGSGGGGKEEISNGARLAPGWTG